MEDLEGQVGRYQVRQDPVGRRHDLADQVPDLVRTAQVPALDPESPEQIAPQLVLHAIGHGFGVGGHGGRGVADHGRRGGGHMLAGLSQPGQLGNLRVPGRRARPRPAARHRQPGVMLDGPPVDVRPP